jgi:hypothetical protein
MLEQIIQIVKIMIVLHDYKNLLLGNKGHKKKRGGTKMKQSLIDE